MIRDRLQAPGWLLAAREKVGGVGADRLVCVYVRARVCVCVGHCFTCLLPPHLREEGPLSGNSLLADLPFLPKPRC